MSRYCRPCVSVTLVLLVLFARVIQAHAAKIDANTASTCLTSLRSWAEESKDSPWQAHANSFTDAEKTCHTSGVCGSLRVPSDDSKFLKRLSSQCKDQMKMYRNINIGIGPSATRSFGWEGSTKSAPPPQLCPGHLGARRPLNPVVVEAPEMHGFALCTIPKSGCSNLRKLTNAMSNFPQSWGEMTSKKASWRANFMPYPTLWHFYNLIDVVEDVYPTFIVGKPARPGSVRFSRQDGARWTY